MNRKLLSALAVAAVPTVVFFAGPRADKSVKVTDVTIPDDLDSYLQQKEAALGDVFEGFEKQILWANEDKRRTEQSIVFIHGFSASRFELSPLVEDLGDSLGANVYFTRLAGHGQPGHAMASASVNDWIYDGLEAIEIGRRIGDNVIIISNSTGSTIAAWICAHPDLAANVAANVMLSPNFGPKDDNARVLLWPWGKQIAQLIEGKERSWEPANEKHGKYWTTSYPTSALVNMMGLVDLLQETNLQTTTVPTQIIYSDKDTVVDPDQIKAGFERLGSPYKRLIAFNDSEDPSNHILAGDVMSPSTTDSVRQLIEEFIR